jgi:uncharacterized protein (TIGR03437 family)
MVRHSAAAMLLLALAPPRSMVAQEMKRPGLLDTGGVLQRLVAGFGSGTSIQGLATDAEGNVLVAGTTSSPNFPTKNAFQPTFGDASVLRSTDLGNTWTRVAAPLDVTSIFPDPVAPQVLFAGGSAGIYKSADAGATWQVVYPFPSGIALQSLAINPGNDLQIIAALNSGTGSAIPLIRSLDGGSTWSASPSTIGGSLLADPTGSGALVVVGLGGGDYISRDWGLTFTAIYPNGAVGNPSTVAFDPSHQGWIYLDVTLGSTGALWLSTDFAVTWTEKASPPTTFTNIMGLEVDPNVPTTLVAATADGFYLSTNGAASWTPTTSLGSFLPDSFHPFVLVNHQCSPGGGLFAIGSGVGFPGTFTVAFSPDDGSTWNTPQLTHVTDVAAGAGCATYITRSVSTDAFVAKLSPNGVVLWATYLGGSDQDTPAGLAVDMQGNAYVTGTTYSPDFPSTLPRIGVPGEGAVFLTEFSPDGTLAYSVLISGEASQTAAAVAVDSGQNVYIIGSTGSMKFPVTPGALVSELSPESFTGFLVKLSPSAAELTGTYLGPSYVDATSLFVGADGEPVLAGTGGPPGLPAPPGGTVPEFIMKLGATGSQILAETYLPGTNYGGLTATALSADAQGDLVLVGPSGAPTPGAYVSPPSWSACSNGPFIPASPGYIYISKLNSANLQVLYTAQLTSPCGIEVGGVAVDSSGAIVLGLSTGPGLPLRDPVLAGPGCSDNSSAIAKLSPDGSTLEFATYLDYCGGPPITLGNDGSIYAGAATMQGAAEVARLSAPTAPPVTVDGISNAFSGDASAIVGGGLYTITGTGCQPAAMDLGLNPSQNLPTQLGGVQVKVGGELAPILLTASGQVTVVAPANPPRNLLGRQEFTTVQLLCNGVESNRASMPVATSIPGLLTASYPSPQPGAQPDGNVHNQDGTTNSANNPAAAGSTITLYATGLGATNPPVAAGSIANSASIVPLAQVWTTWDQGSFTPAPPAPVSSVPGFISALFQIQVQVPASPPGGSPVGNGVQQVPIGLLLNPPPIEEGVVPVSNVVNVYVK